MPPKKKEVEEKMVLIGRMGTNLKVELIDNLITFLTPI